MTTPTVLQVTAIERAIEDLERITHDAIEALRAPNAALSKKVIERAHDVGNAQAAAELVYAALIACKTPVRPDHIELAIERVGFNPNGPENKSAKAARSFVRRIKDNQ